MSSSTNALQDVASVDDFLNVAATETVPLFEHLEFEFLLEYDVFASASRRRTRVHQPPDLFRGFLHCYYKNVYGTRPVTRELQHTLVWYYCGPSAHNAVTVDETYRVALLASSSEAEPSSPQNPGRDASQVTMSHDSSGPPVDEGEVRDVTIETVGDQGDGIAKVERGYVVIVPNAQPGDEPTVEIEQV